MLKIRHIADKLSVENPELAPKCQEVKDMFQDERWYDKPYIVCFSVSRDNLNQWRLYADDARGVAIGFSVSALAKRHHITSNASILRPGSRGRNYKNEKRGREVGNRYVHLLFLDCLLHMCL